MASQVAAFDWSATPFGALDRWSRELRVLACMVLHARQPMYLAWGVELALLYNDAYRELLGDKHPQALGQPLAQVWPEAWEQLGPMARRAMRGEGVWSRDMLLHVERNGQRRQTLFTFSFNPVGDREQGVAGLLCACSERSAADTALRANEARRQESETRFRQLADLGPSMVWFGNPDGSLSFLNERWYEYTGRKATEALPYRWIEVVHPDDQERLLKAWEQARASGDLYEVEARLQRSDGAFRWFLVRALPMRDGAGQITAWLGSNNDIHQRKAMENALRSERDRIWTLSTDLMLVADFTGLIKDVNPAWHDRLGYAEDELVGASLLGFLHSDDVERSEQQMQRLVAGETVLSFENRWRHRDGSYRHLSWAAVPGRGYMHAIGRDVTAERASAERLRRAEDALRQAQKMEAVGQLTGGIAHDFNNLLQGITGSLDLIHIRLRQGRLEGLDQFVASAMGSANRAAALTHRLLAFSRRQPLTPKPVDANRLVASMQQLLRRTMGEQIRIHLRLQDDLWPMRCDPNQLESAVLNLAINARDAMPNGGHLCIETCHVVLDDAWGVAKHEIVAGEYVCIRVSDTGVGMPESVAERAFEPFFTTKPIGKGTGLGLSMIYGFARQSEGCAVLSSEEGKGTRVELYLPRYQGKARAEGNESPTMYQPPLDLPERGVVLVVEDQRVVRGVILELLRDQGYRTLEAADGPTGLDILQSDQRIDLLISDIGLPGLNGRQMADAARQTRPDLKVLFMTGYAEQAALAGGELDMQMELITKPFALNELSRRVQSLLQAG
ncbi:PAS domain S-box protein [Stutzerimonas tarimensis]